MSRTRDPVVQSSRAREGSGAVNATTSSAALVAANPDRVALEVVNDSDTKVYLGLGETAVAAQGIPVAAGQSWFCTYWTGAVNVIHGGSGDKVVCFVEV